MKAAFRVGDLVSFKLPSTMRVEGTIIEDQGPIGRHGRRIYHIEVPMDPDPVEVFVMPEEDLEACNGHGKRMTSIALPAIVQYLKVGGLVSMLRKNNAARPKHLRVWLLPNWLGNLTYTFTEERGLIGGQLIPANALRDNRIHTPKRAEVAQFVRGFGLSKAQAEDVIAEIGTAP